MKTFFALLTIIILFSGSARMQGIKPAPDKVEPEDRLLISIDSLCLATDKLQSISIKTKN